MWVLGKLDEFQRAYRATDLSWDPRVAPIRLQFPEGLLFSLALVTPFWIGVGYVVHVLTK
jgi:hypothetical protein